MCIERPQRRLYERSNWKRGFSAFLRRPSSNELSGERMKKLMIPFGCLFLLIVGAFSVSSARWLLQSESAGRVLTNADLIKLSKSGLSDSVLVERIRCSETNFKTGPDELNRLKIQGVSEAVIREMRNSQKQPLQKCREDSSSKGSVAPQGPTRPVNSRPEELTPAQLKAQEDATSRANLSVPISPRATDNVPDSRSAPQKPMTTPVVRSPQTKAGSPRRPHKLRKRSRIPRKQGDPP
jgi:hypothetical protein